MMTSLRMATGLFGVFKIEKELCLKVEEMLCDKDAGPEKCARYIMRKIKGNETAQPSYVPELLHHLSSRPEVKDILAEEADSFIREMNHAGIGKFNDMNYPIERAMGRIRQHLDIEISSEEQKKKGENLNLSIYVPRTRRPGLLNPENDSPKSAQVDSSPTF